MDSNFGLISENGVHRIVVESMFTVKELMEELDYQKQLPDWTRNVESIETTCLYSHPSNDYMPSDDLEYIAMFLCRKSFSVKHVDFHEYRELLCDINTRPRDWAIPGTDRLKPGPQELRLFDCGLNPSFCSLFSWIWGFPTVRTVRILGDNTYFVNDSDWISHYCLHATQITTFELRVNRLDMVRQALRLPRVFDHLKHLELDLSFSLQFGEEGVLAGTYSNNRPLWNALLLIFSSNLSIEMMQAFRPSECKLTSLRLKLSQCSCCSHRRRFCRKPIRWKWVPKLLDRFAQSEEYPHPHLRKISFDVLYDPQYDNFETSEIWQEIALSLQRVIPQGTGSTSPGVKEIYFVQDCDADTQFLARMSETVKTWLWTKHQIPRQFVYIHGRVD